MPLKGIRKLAFNWQWLTCVEKCVTIRQSHSLRRIALSSSFRCKSREESTSIDVKHSVDQTIRIDNGIRSQLVILFAKFFMFLSKVLVFLHARPCNRLHYVSSDQVISSNFESLAINRACMKNLLKHFIYVLLSLLLQMIPMGVGYIFLCENGYFLGREFRKWEIVQFPETRLQMDGHKFRTSAVGSSLILFITHPQVGFNFAVWQLECSSGMLGTVRRQ